MADALLITVCIPIYKRTTYISEAIANSLADGIAAFNGYFRRMRS